MSRAVTLAHSLLGSGPPLVILHGFMGDRNNWRATARALAGQYTVICADARNHGESPALADMDYRAQAADVIALLDNLGLPAATVLGHSMGGKTAMTLALTAPARVHALAVVDIAPAANTDRFTPLLAAMQALPLAALGSRRDADEALAGAVPDAVLRSFLLKNLVQAEGGYRWRVDLALLLRCLPQVMDFPEPAPAARYEGPALLIRGERSDAVPAQQEPAIRARFPAMHIHTIAGAGHWPHAETPEAFSGLLLPFLAGCRPPEP